MEAGQADPIMSQEEELSQQETASLILDNAVTTMTKGQDEEGMLPESQSCPNEKELLHMEDDLQKHDSTADDAAEQDNTECPHEKEHEILLKEIESLQMERAILCHEKQTLQHEKKVLQHEKEALHLENEALQHDKEILSQEKKTLLHENQVVLQKTRSLELENVKLRENLREYQRSLDQCEIR
jgi:FtsZ-binding cell division protein ZapB